MKREVNQISIPTKLCAVGGFVVGTAALQMVLLGDGPARKYTLRGTNESPPKVTSTVSSGDALARSYSSSPEARATSIDEDDMSNDQDTFQEDMYDWAYEEQAFNMTSDEFSERILVESFNLDPIEGEEHAISSNVSVRTNLFDEDESGDQFRLKMYWRNGYYWQEKTTETWWCMGCRGPCKENSVMELTNCNPRTSKDAQFKLIPQKRGDQFQVVGTDLCLHKMGMLKDIVLKPCSKKNVLQQFTGYRDNGREFDIRPVKSKSRCLTQHHHPKAGELIYAETCRKAHKTKTGYWVKY